MAGTDRSTQRVIAVIALLVLAACGAAWIPPGRRARLAERERPPSSPTALVVVIAMLTAAVAIIGFAIIARMRDRRPRGAAGRRAAERPGTRRSADLALLADRPRRVIGWLALVLLLTRLAGAGPGRAARPRGAVASNRTRPHRARDTDRPPRAATDADAETNVIGYLIPPMLVLMVAGGRRHGDRRRDGSGEARGITTVDRRPR